MDDARLRPAFALQRAAARGRPASGAEERRDALLTLRTLLRENGTRMAEAIAADFAGRALRETELLEILPTLGAIRHARRHLVSWMKTERRPVDLVFQPARAWIRYEPLGVVGVISPWNYPLLLTLAPLVDAIAAGNRVMLKPSELTPGFSELLQRLIARHFDPAWVTVITGDVDVAREFSSLPFDHLLFTGSAAAGKQVMRAAAENLTPVTLELGGKSPAVVCGDYGLEKAARSVAFGKFLNAGQTCVAPDYVLVPAESCNRFAQLVLADAARRYPDFAANSDYSSIISERHAARLAGALQEARAGGATIHSLGATEVPGSTRFPPTVVLGAPMDCTLLREEIFGPILPVVPYRDLDEAVQFVLDRHRPLALYCFSNDRRSREKILDGALSGGVTLNGTVLHVAQDSLPFGGIGPSGIGAYHGHDGFRRFSHARAVYKVGAINLVERLGPPWRSLAAAAVRYLSKR